MAREGSARASAPESVPEGLIVYRDETLLAADKPAGMIVHGDGTGTRTLTDAVAGALGGDPASTGELQAVNRLDRDTTGLVLFSRAKAVQPALDRLVAERAVEKTYLAAVAGSVPWERRTLEQPIGRDRHDVRRMRVSRTGKPARTDARVLARRASGSDGPAATFLLVRLHTGRKHQIRVHLAHAGFPILGDALYGGAGRWHGGLMLHAWRLSLAHPVTGERLNLEAPEPDRFRRLFPHAELPARSR